MNTDALEVAGIFPLAAHRFRLLGIAHPQARDLAILCQQVGDGRPEASPTQNRNGLSFSHSFISSHPRGDGALYGARPLRTVPPCPWHHRLG